MTGIEYLANLVEWIESAGRQWGATTGLLHEAQRNGGLVLVATRAEADRWTTWAAGMFGAECRVVIEPVGTPAAGAWRGRIFIDNGAIVGALNEAMAAIEHPAE